MLISKTAKVKWNSKNKERFINLGYEFTKMGEEFEIKVDDLSNYSNAMIQYECDYCKNVYDSTWHLYNYKRQKSACKNDCCKNCLQLKVKDSCMIKFGTSVPGRSKESIQKRERTNIERYGCSNPFGNKDIQEKIKQHFIHNYGVEYNMQIPERVEKAKKTSLERYGVENYGALWSKQHSGDKSPTWKGDNVIHERTERMLPEYRDWRKKVFNRDSYTCQCCGDRNGNGHEVVLEAHHIFNWSNNPDKRFDVDNGITMCKQCHLVFHSLYGKKDNNDLQLKSFINNTDKKIC